MNFHLENIIQQVRAWFPKAQAHIEAQAAEIEARFNEENYLSLSPEEIANYQDKIQSLSLPKAYENKIEAKIYEVVHQWKNDKNSANHLFITFNPIEPIKSVLETRLEKINNENLPIKTLSLKNRSQDYYTFKNQLESLIESSEDSPDSENNTNSEYFLVIPDLSLCFLRCVEGLDSVEYLLDFILKDQTRFWLIGCNQWTWNYFNYLYKVKSCFEQIYPLPTLNAVQLKQWLIPLYENLDIEFSHNQKNSENLDQDWNKQDEWVSEDEKQYFERLADISEGLSQSAAYLWLDSLRYLKQKKETNPEAEAFEENKPKNKLIFKRATLPNLPELNKDDQYLLSSIGLHGEVNISALAVSLGESDLEVTIQVSRLLKTGIIQKNQDLVRLSPGYYPRLKRYLIDNHILAGEKD